MFSKADVIFTYSRKQALRDGNLVDLTEEARKYGFKVPFACTDTVWRTIEWDEHDQANKPDAGQSTEGRLHDVLTLAILAAREEQGNRAVFKVLMVPKEGTRSTAEPVSLHITIGPGDDADPVCTLMLINED